MAVLWIPVFQCNTIVILSRSVFFVNYVTCLFYQKEAWICIYSQSFINNSVLRGSQPLFRCQLPGLSVNFKYPTISNMAPL